MQRQVGSVMGRIVPIVVLAAMWIVPLDRIATAGTELARGPVPADAYVDDFDHDGYSDLVMGAPNENFNGRTDMGAVNVLYGSSSGVTATGDQFFNQDSANVDGGGEDGDRFGWAVATGNFNRDAYGDVAIGVPNEDVGSVDDAGGVNVIYGSASGLSATATLPDQFWSQDSVDIQETAEAGDVFGSALAAGDFNEDGYTDLAIGVPGERTSQLLAPVGGVNVIYGSPTGLDASFVGDQFLRQGAASLNDTAEPGDFFGYALAAGDFNHDGVSEEDLAIGVPGEDVGDLEDAGAVNVVYGTHAGLSATGAPADQFWTQNSPDIYGSSEEFDEFGKSLAVGDFGWSYMKDLAIGVPGEDLGTVSDAGGVNVIYGTGDFGLNATQRADQFWSQDSSDVEDSGEPDDRFGAALVAADFGGTGGRDDLVAGVPGENVGSVVDAGAVAVIYGSKPGLRATTTPAQLWHQGVTDVYGSTETGDAFGSALGAADFGGGSEADLAVGVPGESVGAVASAGGASVVYGSVGGLSATVTADQFWSQDTAGVIDVCEASDRSGAALAPR
jgi:hypothetical protein